MGKIVTVQHFVERQRSLCNVLAFMKNASIKASMDTEVSCTDEDAWLELLGFPGRSLGCDSIPTSAYTYLGCKDAKDPRACTKKAVCLRIAPMA